MVNLSESSEKSLNGDDYADHYYEGCGEEGPIRSIFFAEFHPVKGPTVRCHAPAKDDPISDEDHHILPYVIPKPELTDRAVTLNVNGYKICGFPRVIDDKKYQRNQFMFNVCFVCYPWSRTVQFEAPLRKLSEFLLNLEREAEFLSNEENTPRLVHLLEEVFKQLNDSNAAFMTVEKNSLNLKVVFHRSDPPAVADWDVPVVCVKAELLPQCLHQWDLTTQQIIPHINGCNHVMRICSLADVELGLVKACVQNLIYHRVVQCVNHVFQFENQYMVTPEIRVFRENPAFRREFMDFLFQGGETGYSTTFNDVLELVADFKHGNSVKDICLKHRPKRRLGLDIFRLVQYLVLKGVVRRLQRYPVHLDYNTIVKQKAAFSNNEADEFMYLMFDGQHHMDEICMRCQLSETEIMEKIEDDHNVLCIIK